MFTVKPSDAAEFSRQFDLAMAEIKRKASEVFRGYTVAAFHYVLRETPQWSGGAVSNWNYDVGAATYRVDTDLKAQDSSNPVFSLAHPGPRQKNDPRAIQVAVGRNAGREVALSYTQPVYINNAAEDLDGEKYIQYLEENPNNYLRHENEPGHMVEYCRRDLLGAMPQILSGSALETRLRSLNISDFTPSTPS